MRFDIFKQIVSEKRIARYVLACGGDTRKAMILYRYNIELSQIMFAIICHFEVALRNAFDSILTISFGNEWLKDSAQPGGLFDTTATRIDFINVKKSYDKLLASGLYSHSKLLASMEFGGQRIFPVGEAWLIKNKVVPLHHGTNQASSCHPSRCADRQL